MNAKKKDTNRKKKKKRTGQINKPHKTVNPNEAENPYNY